MIKVIHGQIWSEDFSKLEQLSRDFNSCVRFAYNQFHKNEIEFNDARIEAKARYKTLNTRQVSDAVMLGKAIKTRNKDNKVIFGGKRLFERLKTGVATKEQWVSARDYKIYARGDVTKTGNPNIRIVGNNIRVTTGTRQFEYYPLFVPSKYRKQLQDLIQSGQAYNVRLKRQDARHWRVVIDYALPNPEVIVNFDNGTIGVDTNVDRIAICEIGKDGNYIGSKTLINSRLKDGSTDKRNYDIGCMVKQIVQLAKEKQKGIIFENLKFKKDRSFSKKNNRVKSNFVWFKFLELLERKCIEHGITYKKVHPAYTSFIGKIKYSGIYKLTTHEAAAFVIARRGLGFDEKISLWTCPGSAVKERIIGTLVEKYGNKRFHNWQCWGKLKTILTGYRNSMYNLQELYDALRFDGVIPSRKSSSKIDRGSELF